MAIERVNVNVLSALKAQRWFLFFLLFMHAGWLLGTSATHVRYGSLTWSPVPNRTNTISLTVRVAIRKHVYRGTGYEGARFYARFENLRWDGSSGFTRLGYLTTAVGGVFDDWVFATKTLQHTYSQAHIDSNAFWDITLAGCCRYGKIFEKKKS